MLATLQRRLNALTSSPDSSERPDALDKYLFHARAVLDDGRVIDAPLDAHATFAKRLAAEALAVGLPARCGAAIQGALAAVDLRRQSRPSTRRS